ncbi:hypothetical protein GAO09_10980 [Rhizobiales bacterium RZME27]|uniref:DUF6894 domain-containing protein n=1 Tax=Endobacterium cereale TaxID=2663029 RepID=A0A6A8A9L7_9HYPH|nr:hypothetical protein [Endobacterium cereale]MEB2846716.1 hypothetical protein [Endobacterium cereale]MQY46567.1 hypothetical protein [Endobacterium cereale]
MPKYYFDVENGHGHESDDIGSEHQTLESVGLHIGKILTDIARDEIPGTHSARIIVRARDEQGNHVGKGRLSFETEW